MVEINTATNSAAALLKDRIDINLEKVRLEVRGMAAEILRLQDALAAATPPPMPAIPDQPSGPDRIARIQEALTEHGGFPADVDPVEAIKAMGSTALEELAKVYVRLDDEMRRKLDELTAAVAAIPKVCPATGEPRNEAPLEPDGSGVINGCAVERSDARGRGVEREIAQAAEIERLTKALDAARSDLDSAMKITTAGDIGHRAARALIDARRCLTEAALGRKYVPAEPETFGIFDAVSRVVFELFDLRLQRDSWGVGDIMRLKDGRCVLLVEVRK